MLYLEDHRDRDVLRQLIVLDVEATLLDDHVGFALALVGRRQDLTDQLLLDVAVDLKSQF